MDKRRLIAAALAAGTAGALWAAPAAEAAFIDFEGGTDDQQIFPDTFADTNVRFVALNDHTLFFEGRGEDGVDGYLYDQGGRNDVEAPGAGSSLGNYFMRAENDVHDRTIAPGKVFSMEYDRGVLTPISGEIWDIDGERTQGTEQWVVSLYGSGGQLAEVTSPLGTDHVGGSLDGLPWSFQFDGSDAGFGSYSLTDVRRVDFAFVGDKSFGNGFGFDNFDTGAPVPLPAAAWFLITALGGLFGVRWLGGRKAA
jgi:hypothetical protein